MSLEKINKININKVKIVDKIQDRLLDNSENPIEFARLQNSIKEDGLLNPLIFARIDDNTLEILCGRRRLKALRGIYKTNPEFENVECKIYSVDTDRIKRNIIAFSDNQNRKDLSSTVKFYPLFLLIAANFYNLNIDIKESNIIGNVVDTKLFEYLQKFDYTKPSDNPTYKLIVELSNQIKLDTASFIAEICKISSLDYNLYMMKRQNSSISIKDLLKFKNSNEPLIKILYSEINTIMTLLSVNTEINYDKINEIAIQRFSIECPHDIEHAKSFIDKILPMYLNEMSKIQKENTKKKDHAGVKEIKSFLKNAKEADIEKVLDFIKQIQKDS